jgi:site-specific DNA recombinase
MSRGIIYVRVSTTEQAEKGMSLDEQTRTGKEHAGRLGIEVDKIFREEGESAKSIDRTEFTKAIEYCRKNKGKIDFFIVYKLDRFARNAEDHHMVRAILSKLGVQLISVTEPIGDTVTGRLMEGILAQFAQFDNEVRAERSSLGMIARLEAGSWTFQAPVGLLNTVDALERPTLKIDPIKGPLVQKVLKEFLTGTYTQKDIAKYATNLGIKCSTQTINKMLRNPLYGGRIASSMIEGTREGLHKGLISWEEFLGIQDILSGKRRSYTPSLRLGLAWPLRGGFVRCAICQTPITSSSPRGNGGVYHLYSCPTCRTSQTHKRVSVEKNILHEQFAALLEAITPTEPVLRLYKEAVIARWKNEYKDARVARRQADHKLEELEAKKDKVIDLFIADKLTEEQKNDKIEKIEALALEVELSRNEFRENEQNIDAVVGYATNFIGNTAKLWRDADAENKQRFQKMIFPEGIIYDFGVGFGTAKLGLAYGIIGQLADENNSLVALSIDTWNLIKRELVAWYEAFSQNTLNQTTAIA